ncbi:phage baseplate assembly protein [Budviciaceae bacterium CWB-B4]|uniref:Phage baseplate assembly protein n=1 Tax=Limnobaculum xujianqingii TaxID=2738837 RepID=A0A9D7FWH4_9GAMM|nr:phage baseplate assembly protein [Limnobaculum xujianqingii]MBK5075083.1 phage baseplate assembly protein [Limnobaculum xujianqingii]MBK5178382.1 phage baseplate assembly protein [Limnobaculum xujianqingii]
MNNIQDKVERLYRQVKMMVGIGKLTTSSDTGSVQSVQYQTPLEVKGGTPRFCEFGFSSGLPPGSDVVIISLGGDRSSTAVIASNHQSSRHTGLLAGETVIYNQWGMFVKLTETGIEIEANGQPVTVSHATEVTINATDSVLMKTPILKTTGDIVDNCESNTQTLKALRDAYNQHAHPVKNVQGGNLTITSEISNKVVK